MPDRGQAGGTVGERIRARRALLGLTLDELGELAGVKGGSIWRYEHGQMSPGREAILGLARALGVSVEWLTAQPEASGEHSVVSLEVLACPLPARAPDAARLALRAVGAALLCGLIACSSPGQPAADGGAPDACVLTGCDPTGAAYAGRAEAAGCPEPFVCPDLLGANVCCAPALVDACTASIEAAATCADLAAAVAGCRCR